jgi:hypothetical protein
MLSIFFEESSCDMHVGSDFNYVRGLAHRVVAVQADGDELVKILDSVENLMQHKTKHVQRFYGDVAKFIVGNVF